MENVACDLCHSLQTEVVVQQRDFLSDSPELFTVVRCLECGLRYLNPRPSRDEIGRLYPTEYFAPVSVRTRTGIQRLAKQVSAWIKQGLREEFYGYPSAAPWWVRGLRRLFLYPEYVKCLIRQRDVVPWIGTGRLLDIGCGVGANLQVLQGQGWDVQGIDFSDHAVTIAREKLEGRVYAGTLETAPYSDGSFDIVLMSHTLEHMLSPVATLARVRQLLQPDGMVVIAVPNAGSLEARVFKRWWFPWELPRHFYHFDKPTLSETLRKAGFRVIRMRTAIGSLFFMASLDRFWMQQWNCAPFWRWLIDHALVRPLCFLLGHLGFGTEIKIYAVKDRKSGEAGYK